MNNLKAQIRTIAMTRLMIDMETSLLLTIKSNLKTLFTEEIEGMDEVSQQFIKSAWAAEIGNIKLELIRRN